MSMKRQLRASLLATLFVSGLSTSQLLAQCCAPALTVRPKVVMEWEEEKCYKIEQRTEYDDREVISQRPVLKYRMEKRMVPVTKPVTETSTVEEKYTVLVPVKKQAVVDRSYYKTDMVTETAQREEVYSALRPVTETQYQTQQIAVPRTVTETQYQTQQYTTYSPVTTYQTATVDAGGYMAQNYYAPGVSRYRLGTLPGGTAVDTATGLPFYHRAQFGWVPTQTPGAAYTAMYYQPNPQQVAIPQTTLMPQVQTQQVPVQVSRVETDYVQQQVPVTVTRMQPIEERRMVPYTTTKPVTQYIERKEQVEQTEYQEQVLSRPKTITQTSYKTENVEQEVQISYYEMEEVRTPVKVPRTVTLYIPDTRKVLRPRTVYDPVTLNYFDPYSSAISQGYTTFAPIISAPATSSSTGASPSDQSKQSVKKIETGDLPSKKPSGTDNNKDKESAKEPEPESLDLNSATGSTPVT